MPCFNPIILSFDSLPSTNTEAAERARNGAPEGLVVTSLEQTAGRGRLARQWISPRDAGLYLSIVLRPVLEPRQWPLITMAAAVAVYDALLESCDLETEIKWPNDLLATGRKISGILAETVDTSSGHAVVLGVGINLTSEAFPTELAGSATSVKAASGKAPDREMVLQCFLRAFADRYEVLQAEGGNNAIIRLWSSHSSYAAGKRIRVTDNGQTIEGTARGVEGDGALRVETDGGEVRIVHAGDVTVLK